MTLDNHLKLELFGIKAEYRFKPEETAQATRLISMLEIQQQHRPTDANDALRKTYAVGLGEPVFEAFKRSAHQEQIKAALGFAGSIGLYALGRKLDLPIMEVGAGVCGLANIVLYVKAGLAEFVAEGYLRGRE